MPARKFVVIQTALCLFLYTNFRTKQLRCMAEPINPRPKIKSSQGRFNFWLGRTDSNHDKENQNLLSYH